MFSMGLPIFRYSLIRRSFSIINLYTSFLFNAFCADAFSRDLIAKWKNIYINAKAKLIMTTKTHFRIKLSITFS